MKILAEQLESLILQDPGNRRIGKWAHKGDIEAAVKSLYSGNHIVLTTGFYIIKANAIETDGPPGTIVLAKALNALGKKVTLLIDDHAVDIMQAGAESINFKPDIIALQPSASPDLSLLLDHNVSHFVAIERPGRTQNNDYYNCRGVSVAKYHSFLDDLFVEASQHNITTIGIGDGGNEMGMGNVSERVNKYVANGSLIGSITPSDYCICAGVSNWACYAITALLSFIENVNLLPSKEELVAILDSIIDHGAVDGISGLPTPTVDGLPQEWELNILHGLQELLFSRLQAATTR